MDVDRRGDEVERESFLRSVGERDFDSCFFCTPGDAEELRSLRRVLTGDSSSSSEPPVHSDLSGLVPGSLEPDLDLETSRSLGETVNSICSLALGTSFRGCNLSEGLSVGGLEAAAGRTGFHAPAWYMLNDKE